MKLIAAGSFIFMVLVLMSVPALAPRNTLFGVRTGVAFRDSQEARRVIQLFHRYLLAALVAGLILVTLASGNLGLVVPPAIAVATFVGIFVVLNRRLKPHAQSMEAPLQIDLAASDRMPGTKWLMIIPLGLVCSTALYLRQNWDRIPQRFPVRFSADGQPVAWADRTPQVVFGFLIVMSAFLIWLIVLNAALWYGVRRSRMRIVCFQSILLAQFAMGLVPSYVALSPLFKPSPSVALAVVIAPVLLILILAWRQVSSSEREPDTSPEGAWTGGLLYFNPHDAAWAVPRRDGFGYTPNLAHVTTWVLFLIPLAIGACALRWLG